MLYISDHYNHRIVKWKIGDSSGQVVAGGRGKGARNDQLNRPWRVAVDKATNHLWIADCGNHRVVRWNTNQRAPSGKVLISGVTATSVVVDEEGFLYITDYHKHEVRRWRVGSSQGILVAGGKGAGSGLNQLKHPSDIFIDRDHSLYIADRHNHRIVKWVKGAKLGTVVAGGSVGSSLSQLNYPLSVVVDQMGTLYIADAGNNRVMR